MMTMKSVFPLLFLLFSIVYTIMSFGFNFVTETGRPDAGFFPVLIGVLLIFFSGLSSYKSLREDLAKKNKDSQMKTYVKEMIWVILLAALFVLLLRYAGALVTMAVYIFASLFLFNRKKMLQNVLLSVILPTVIFLMFETWLNAGLPEGFLQINHLFR